MKTHFLLFLILIGYTKVFAQTDLEKLIKNDKIVGAQVAWVNKKGIQKFYAGFSNIDTKSFVSDKTIFQAASLSKVVLSYICLEMAKRKQIDLDKPLLDYYSYNRLKQDTSAHLITARMVLKHSSGLPNWAENPLKKTWGTSKLNTRFVPGSSWQYSGEGYVFLQLAIQNILKKDLQQIAAEMVFEPFAMKNSSFIWEERFEDFGAYGHTQSEELATREEFFLPNAAFSLYTTKSDYVMFLSSFLRRYHHLIASDMISVSNKSKMDENAKHIFWGVGMGLEKNELGTAYWHWGDNGDFKAFFIAYPDKEEFLVCFTNSANGLKLMNPLFNDFFGKVNWYANAWLN